MAAGLPAALLSFLRVPAEPDPPAGAPGSLRAFRAARSFLGYQLFGWVLKQLGVLWGLVFGLYFVRSVPDFPYDFWLRWAEYFGIATFAIQLPLTFVAIFYEYRLRWYVVTDRSLRIREGIFRIQERTMSFANIQNLGIKQGPIQRLLGISDLEVKSAGGGGGAEAKGKHHESGDDLHTGYFRGVDNAEEIKGLILERLRRLRDSGLGDPEEEGEAEATAARGGDAPGGVLAAARELREEARLLRRALG